MATANNMKIIFDLHYRRARFAPPSMPANYAITWADHSAFCDGHSAPALWCPSTTVGCCVIGYSHFNTIRGKADLALGCVEV